MTRLAQALPSVSPWNALQKAPRLCLSEPQIYVWRRTISTSVGTEALDPSLAT
jgi:hypothetical protein